MDIQVTTRHCTIPEPVRQRAEERAHRLTRYEPRITLTEVVFSEDGASREVELIVSVPGAPPLVARSAADSFRAAVDAAAKKITRRLKRLHDRRMDHQADKPQPAPEMLEA